jgi:hypothetical protein
MKKQALASKVEASMCGDSPVSGHKLLEISAAHFYLPDNFDGSFLDALELLVAYLRQREQQGNVKSQPSTPQEHANTEGMSLDEFWHNSWQSFQNAVQNGNLFEGTVDVLQLTPDGQGWKTTKDDLPWQYVSANLKEVKA